MQKIQFDYFTGMEAEQYSFYRVPKVLFTEPCFKTLSCEAKVLYGLMLDRMSLSIKNRWLDSEDRVYIIFTVEEIAELMNCGTGKRAGQQQWDWIDREETSGTGKTECYLCEKFYDQRGSRPKANRELCRFAI